MKGDFTRSTFDHKKHYSGVRMQQGRVQLDADWNEQVDIQAYLLEQRTEDVVGLCGAPIHKAGFALGVEGGKLKIGKGHYYVDGILCENEKKCEFTDQDDLPDAKLPTGSGNYLFYLDVWQRHITAMDDDTIREKALDGPDTATRMKTIWQVKHLKLTETLGDNPCIQDFEKRDETKKRDACLKASEHHKEPPTDPCIVPPGAGYRGLENHLYRVEIHRINKAGKATFKWSRDNGSVVRAVDVENIKNDTITIIDPGQDVLHAFAPGQWVEITDDLRELNEQPGTLVCLTEVTDGVKLKYDPDDPDTIVGNPVNHKNFLIEQHNPKVRRWDQTVSGEMETGTEWIALESGLKVCFEAGGDYRSGDYWLIPARADEGKIEWPKDSNDKPLALQRFGIMHHYCPLTIVQYDGGETGSWKLIKDCRKIFPPMTEMVTLSYVGGDGQDAMLGKKLPAPLEVRVAIGQHPIEGARVRFTITEGVGGGVLEHTEEDAGEGVVMRDSGSLVIKTDSRGLASCSWTLDGKNRKNQSQRVEATLLDEDGNPVLDGSISFNANLIRTLSYVGGDGQEAMPGYELPAPLEVRVAIGQHPIEGAIVQFSITEGEGKLDGDPDRKVEITTDSRGIASCSWTLDGKNQSQRVEATLLDAVLLDEDGTPVRDKLGQSVYPSISFNASLSLASQVAYNPKCTYLIGKKGVETVQAAIDELCNCCREHGIHITRVLKGCLGGVLGNDTEVSVDELMQGLRIGCDREVDQSTVKGKPTCYVTLHLPYPFNPADREMWGDQVIGFQPLILRADVYSKGKAIYWEPTSATGSWLRDGLFSTINELKLDYGGRILACLTLKGNFIWAAEDPSLYMDGEAFGVRSGDIRTSLRLPSGNGRRGGDFEMWFWLVEEPVSGITEECIAWITWAWIWCWTRTGPRYG